MMVSSGIHIGLVLVLVAFLHGGAMAQPSSCNNVLSSMASCLNYVTGNSSTPSSSCCSQLANVVQNSLQCLCAVLNSTGPSLGVNINQTLALNLIVACNVQTPPISQCKDATAPISSVAPVPVGSPTSSPAYNDVPDPATKPSASNTPSASGTGSKTIPSTNGTSDGSMVKAPLHLLLFILFILWCGSNDSIL